MGYPKTTLSECVDELVYKAHGAAKRSGWWDDVDINNKYVIATKLCLVHSEISEAMEGHRKDKNDDHLPERKMIEVELADAMIRIADLAGALGLDLGAAVEEKMQYNARRSDHKKSERVKTNGKSY